MALIYAGIGSRKTPTSVMEIMHSIGAQLAPNWILRSGHADGADLAFEAGCVSKVGTKEIYLPWSGFNMAPEGHDYIVPKPTVEACTISARYHPTWDQLKDSVKLLHARNVCQILGQDLNTPADMVVCWTMRGKGTGGTGQAIRIARGYNIPVFDLGISGMLQRLCDFTKAIEEHKS